MTQCEGESTLVPRFSIVIPAYNDWIPLKQCLQSLAQQTNAPEFEVIIFDDGSTEAAPEYLRTGNVATSEQMGKGRQLVCPGEFFQHAAQVDDIVGACNRGQWRVLRPQQSQPTEDMRITAQLIERANLGMPCAHVNEEVPDRTAIGSDGGIPQRSCHRFCRWPEELCQRMSGEREAFSFHECDGGRGRMCWATARAYCSQTSCGVR